MKCLFDGCLQLFAVVADNNRTKEAVNTCILFLLTLTYLYAAQPRSTHYSIIFIATGLFNQYRNIIDTFVLVRSFTLRQN